MTSPSPAATTGPIIQKDSRRLPGVSLLWDRPGAILDVAFPDDVAEQAVGALGGGGTRHAGRRRLEGRGNPGPALPRRCQSGPQCPASTASTLLPK